MTISQRAEQKTMGTNYMEKAKRKKKETKRQTKKTQLKTIFTVTLQ